MARRRWIAEEWTETTATLRGEQARHLARVLRATPGMRCDVVAGDRVWSAVVEMVEMVEIGGRVETVGKAELVEMAGSGRVVLRLGEALAAEEPLQLTLVLAVFKFDRMEWAIEKATELGVAKIVPVVARRTEKHLGQAAVARVERWRRIAMEASKQSRRADVPVVDDCCGLDAALRQEWAGERLLLAESERVVMLREALEGRAEGAEGRAQVTLAVGPEGGWTVEEQQLFVARGWRAVSLGPRILRAETAAITGVAVAASVLLG